MSFGHDETAIARQNSITELCAAFAQSSAEIKTAFALIVEAQNRLRHFFQGDSCSLTILSDSRRGHRPDIENPGATITELSRVVWSSLVGRLELRKMMSLKRIADLDKQLETGDDLPPLTASNVLAMLETSLNGGTAAGNAALFASAPSLLTALKAIALESQFDADGDSISRGDKLIAIGTLARAAIARAEGGAK